MTCTLLGLILSCLTTPAPPPEVRAATLKQYEAVGYISTVRTDGWHVIFALPSVPAPPPVYVPSPQAIAAYEAYLIRPDYRRRRR